MKTSIAPNETAIVSNAVCRIADLWQLTNDELGAIVGISAPSASRLKGRMKDLQGKEVELGLLLVRVFRDIDALMGGNTENIKAWIESYNHHLQGIPKQLLKNVEGLVDVVRYLDAMRGKI